MQKDDTVYVRHMLDMAKNAMAKMQGKSRSEYDQNEVLRLALSHLIQVIGEAARRVSISYRQAHPEIPWREIVGIRHKVVHDYMEVDYDVLWQVVTEDLPSLIAALEKIVPPDDVTSAP